MSNTKTATITRRTRALGWAYSTIPTGNGTEIALPTRPMHEGRPHQIITAIREDAGYRACAGVYKAEAWFYKGKRITRVLGMPSWMTVTDAMQELLDDDFLGTLTVELE